MFTTEVIEKKLSKPKTTKSAGPDGFHPRILSEPSSSISLPLSIICKKSFEEGPLGFLLVEWKKAPITPIHKKGSNVIPGNYRPVSLTYVIGKLMESVIRDALVKHMMDQTTRSPWSYGRSYSTAVPPLTWCISISGRHSTLSLIKGCSGNSVLMVYLASC